MSTLKINDKTIVAVLEGFEGAGRPRMFEAEVCGLVNGAFEKLKPEVALVVTLQEDAGYMLQVEIPRTLLHPGTKKPVQSCDLGSVLYARGTFTAYSDDGRKEGYIGLLKATAIGL